MMHIRTPSDTTFEFYAIRASVAPRRPRIELSPPSEASSAVDPIARLTRECAALRLRLATAERRQRLRFTGSFTAPCSPPSAILDLALETASAHGNAARDQVQIGVMKLSERYRALEKTMREVQESLRLRDREVEALREERDRLLREREQTKAERDQAKIECDQERVKNHSLTKEIKHLQERVRSLKHSGEDGNYHYRSRTPSHSRRAARRSEAPSPVPQGPNSHPSTFLDAEEMARIKSRDVFLTKTDNWSGAQVFQAIEDLNAEITQFAASATESCTFARRTMRNTVARGDADIDGESTPWLGEAFVRLLEARDHARDPILLQLALQASLAACCARSLALFCVGFPSKLDALLSRVLTYMYSVEPQATSARWRALTHRSIRMLYPNLEEYAVTELVATMLRWSATVFSLAGAEPSSSPGAQLRRIAEAVYRLARITREEILSTTFEVVLVDSGETFEATRMIDKMCDYGEHPDAGTKPTSIVKGRKAAGFGRKVLCTTELGLRCVTRKGTKSSLEETQTEEGGLFDSRLLLLPKVVLNSVLEAIERG